MAGEVRKVCEQKCYLTVGFQGVYGSPWPSSTTGDKSFLVLSRVLALPEVCVWPGDGEWGSEILMENKKEHHVPSVLTHSVLLRNKHRRNRSQQETPQSCLFQPHSPSCMPSGSLHCGGARPQSPGTGHPERGSRFGLTHHFFSHPPIHGTPDTCKQKGNFSSPTGSWPF